jgi:site-specific recombinase XerD
VPARRFAVVAPSPSTELDASIGDYLASVKARGLSPRTVEHYESVLRRLFLPFLVGEQVTTPAQITQRVLDRLSAHLLDGGGPRGPLSRHSAASYLRAIGSYLKWAKSEGEIATDAKPQPVRLPRRVMVVMERKQIDAIEDAATDERDKLIIRVLAECGLRMSEMLGLTTGDLIEQGNRDRYLKVTGKGSRDRLVPVQPALYSRLRRYIDRTRPKDAGTDRVFLTLRRSRATGAYEPLKKRAVGDLCDALAEKAGVTDRPHNPHAYRHAFATYALRKGMNPLMLQRILGHADLTMITSTYSHLVAADTHAALMAVLRSEE